MACKNPIASNKFSPLSFRRTVGAGVSDLPLALCPIDFKLLNEPSDVVLTQLGTAVVLTWTDNNERNSGHEIQVRINGGAWGVGTTVGADDETGQVENTGWVNGDNVEARVRAIGQNDNSDYVESNSITVSYVIDGGSTITISLNQSGFNVETDVDGDFEITLDSFDMPNAIEAEIEFRVNAGAWGDNQTVGVGAIDGHIDTISVTEGDTVRARIKGKNAIDESAWFESGDISARMIPENPDSITNLTATSTGGTGHDVDVEINNVWNHGFESNFILYYRINGGSWVYQGDYSGFGDNGAEVSLFTTTFAINEDGGGTIEVAVRMVNPDESEAISDYLVSSVENFLGTPTAPSGVVIDQQTNSTTFDFDWVDNSASETSFEVQYKKNAGSWTALTGSPFAANTESATEVVATVSGDDMQMRVRSVGAGGNSAWVESSTIEAVFVPSAPASLSLSESGSALVTFSWGAVSDADDYRVEYKLNLGAWTVIDTVASSPSTHTPTSSYGGANGDDLRMRVTARNAAGNSPYGTSSEITLANQPS